MLLSSRVQTPHLPSAGMLSSTGRQQDEALGVTAAAVLGMGMQGGERHLGLARLMAPVRGRALPRMRQAQRSG